MQMLRRYRYIIILLLATLLISGCSTKKENINDIGDLSNKKVGIYTGSEYDSILKGKNKKAIPTYFNSYNDEILALKSGKISAFLTDEPLAKEILRTHNDLTILEEKITNDNYAFAINPKLIILKEEIDSIINEMQENNYLKYLSDKWFGDDDSKKILEEYDYKSSKTIKFATVSGSAPFAYMKNNTIVGYDIDVINYIGYKLGYKINIIEMNFEAIIPALVSGKVDIAGCSIIVTEERKKSVLFSIPNYNGGIVLVVNK